VDAKDADAHGNEPVYYNNERVGLTTSGGYGFRVKKSLAFAYVKPETAKTW
jgi:dimethylglycine dehydrogenase